LTPDNHISLDQQHYSIPYKLVKKELDVRFTQTTVEIFHKGERIASHRRSKKKNSRSTKREHMPLKHRAYAEWTFDSIIKWSKQQRTSTRMFIEKMLESQSHIQQAVRSSVGVIQLGKSFGKERLESACQRALTIRAINYKSVLSILKNNLDQFPVINKSPLTHVTEQSHKYIRGKQYFQ